MLVKVYTNDLAPRSDHSTLYQLCEVAVRVVGCGIPFLMFLNYHFQVYWGVYAVAGGAVFLSVLFLLPLPETRGRAKPENVDQFMSLFYGSRFRPAHQPYTNGHVITPVSSVKLSPDTGHHFTAKPERRRSEPTAQSSSKTWSGGDRRSASRDPLQSRQNTCKGKNRTLREYDLSLLSNTDLGNLSLHDPDTYKLPKLSPNLESTRISDLSTLPPRPVREKVRPKSLNLHRKTHNRPTISRNPSYESSLNDASTIMTATPDTGSQLSPDVMVTPNETFESPINDTLGGLTDTIVTPFNKSTSVTVPSRGDEETIKRNSLVSLTPKSSGRKEFFSLSRV